MGTIVLKCGLEVDERLRRALATAEPRDVEWVVEDVAMPDWHLPMRVGRARAVKGIAIPPEMLIAYATVLERDGAPSYHYVNHSLAFVRPGRTSDVAEKYTSYNVPNERVARMAVLVEL